MDNKKGDLNRDPLSLQELLGMVRPVIFVPYFLQIHSATGQSFTFTINFETNQFHLQTSLHQNACNAIPHFTNNFPIIYFLDLFF
jgi:hypothetical protein|tara:strand:- start:1761 stop:2015 length:255 start_codon:yes stop_codon:yes gene_type:complete